MQRPARELRAKLMMGSELVRGLRRAVVIGDIQARLAPALRALRMGKREDELLVPMLDSIKDVGTNALLPLLKMILADEQFLAKTAERSYVYDSGFFKIQVPLDENSPLLMRMHAWTPLNGELLEDSTLHDHRAPFAIFLGSGEYRETLSNVVVDPTALTDLTEYHYSAPSGIDKGELIYKPRVQARAEIIKVQDLPAGTAYAFGSGVGDFIETAGSRLPAFHHISTVQKEIFVRSGQQEPTFSVMIQVDPKHPDNQSRPDVKSSAFHLRSKVAGAAESAEIRAATVVEVRDELSRVVEVLERRHSGERRRRRATGLHVAAKYGHNPRYRAGSKRG